MRLFAFLLIFLTSPTLAKVTIDPFVEVSVINKFVRIGPGSVVDFPLSVAAESDVSLHFEAHDQTARDITVVICKVSEVASFKARKFHKCYMRPRANPPFDIQFKTSDPNGHVLLISNQHSILSDREISVHARAKVQIPQAAVQPMQVGLEAFAAGVSSTFAIPELDMTVRSCGMENAFSATLDGAITLCTELIYNLFMQGNQGALIGVLLHEVGHSLLNLWGMPNYDNEQTVDEFAIVQMYWESRQEWAFQFAAYFDAKDSGREAESTLRYSNKHPISVQRARNIRQILEHPEPVVARWNNFLYPQMTAKALRQIIANPGRFGDPAMARKVLASKRAVAPIVGETGKSE